MPELPEVETTARGIRSHIESRKILDVKIRNNRLRWPVDNNLSKILASQTLKSVTRRAKYLLLNFETGTLIIHLGMSGSLRVITEPTELKKHDHISLFFDNEIELRYHDPRRFGAMLWTEELIEQHPLFIKLGPEPSEILDPDYLYKLSRDKKAAIKSFIMDNHHIVGVGNIYANEALFLSGIHPKRAAGKISKARFRVLQTHIQAVLKKAIEQGGTTLRDFVNSDGQPGYFAQQLNVYGKAGESCPVCETTIKSLTIAQRNTFYCPNCQR